MDTPQNEISKYIMYLLNQKNQKKIINNLNNFKNHINPNFIDLDNTILTLAIKNKLENVSIQIIKLFYKYNILDYKDINNNTILQLAISHKLIKLTNYLIDNY
jgi:hypothetical protein